MTEEEAPQAPAALKNGHSSLSIRELLGSLKPAEVWAVCVALTGLFGGACSTGYWAGQHFNSTTTSGAPSPSDVWSEWERSTDQILACKNDNARATTIDGLISRAPAPVISSDRPDLARNERDARVGRLLLAKAPDLLWRHFGIDKTHFQGTGVSLPDKAASISAAFTEYWAPQMSENRVGVWTWQLAPAILSSGRPLHELLADPAVGPTAASDEPSLKFASCIAALQNNSMGPSADPCRFRERLNHGLTPALFRCSQFPAGQFHGNVGRDESKTAFFVRLRDALELPADEACSRTGRVVDAQDKTKTLFLWVVFPENADEALPATWTTLLEHFSSWEGVK